jgi:AraC-like DNA-binding protein
MAIAQLHTIGTPTASAAASAAMLELLLWLSMQAGARGGAMRDAPRGAAAVERAATLLHERLAEALDIPSIAEEVDLTQNYLAKMFRQRFGMTMPRFLLTSRMNQAKHLLRHTTVPVWRVGQRVGLPDVQHFNKQFRRLTGMSPSAYRNQG